MAFAHLEVVRVMGRRDLHCTGPELFIHIVVCHDRDLSSYQRKDHILSDDILISLVVRVHRNSSIPQHRLRTRGRDLEETVRTHDRVFDVPEVSLLLLVLYLSVRERGLTFRTPVDDPGSLVNISLLI